MFRACGTDRGQSERKGYRRKRKQQTNRTGAQAPEGPAPPTNRNTTRGRQGTGPREDQTADKDKHKRRGHRQTKVACAQDRSKRQTSANAETGKTTDKQTNTHTTKVMIIIIIIIIKTIIIIIIISL